MQQPAIREMVAIVIGISDSLFTDEGEEKPLYSEMTMNISSPTC